MPLDINKNLSPHFTVAECTKTKHTEFSNSPDAEEFARMKVVCECAMELIRAKFGVVIVHSFYRSEGVNRAAGGQPNSQHRLGEACDFHCQDASLDTVYDWIVNESGIEYDQVFIEHDAAGNRWIHLSYTLRHSPRLAALSEITKTKPRDR